MREFSLFHLDQVQIAPMCLIGHPGPVAQWGFNINVIPALIKYHKEFEMLYT